LVRLILIVEWDPIGVFGYARTMNEYDAYASKLHGLLKDEADIPKIADHLYRIETGDMGLRGNRERTLIIAKRLKDVYARSVNTAFDPDPDDWDHMKK
jgi:hypothetical protein